MLVNATSIDFGICAAPTTTAERPQTTVLFFRDLLAPLRLPDRPLHMPWPPWDARHRGLATAGGSRAPAPRGAGAAARARARGALADGAARLGRRQPGLPV